MTKFFEGLSTCLFIASMLLLGALAMLFCAACAALPYLLVIWAVKVLFFA